MLYSMGDLRQLGCTLGLVYLTGCLLGASPDFKLAFDFHCFRGEWG